MTTAVNPAMMSSFSSRSVVSLVDTFRRRAFATTWSRRLFRSACSKPATWVPPFGVAMMLTKDRTSVSYPVPHRSATSTSQVRVTSRGTM